MSKMFGKNILVTGGAGFIGSYVAELFMEKGYRVRILDNLSTGNLDWIPLSADFIEGDVTDLETCRKAVKGVVAVFHLAAMSKVFPSLGDCEKNLFTLKQNVLGTLNLLITSHQERIQKFIYSASSTYYGNQPIPFTEDMPPQCITPYALSKYEGELYCLLFNQMYNLPTVSLRYFQTYGPRQSTTGEYAVVVGVFLEQRKQDKPLTIFGDGTQRRDFVHVKDVAYSNYLALNSPIRGMSINIGSGENHSIQELADVISDKQIHVAPREHDLKETLADLTLCRQYFNWIPQISFQKGMRELICSTT